MSGKTSFEQLCAGRTGYACDESSMAKLTKEESYRDLLFKVVTKCETNLLFLPSPTCTVSHFTLDIVPHFCKSSVAAAWETCEKQGYDGLQVICTLDTTNMPRNGCVSKYTFVQFVNSVIHSMESYFMFERYNTNFDLNGAKLWENPEDSERMRSCAVVVVWKFQRESVKDLLSRSPLSQLNSSFSKILDGNVRGDLRNNTVNSEQRDDLRNNTVNSEQERSQVQRRKSIPIKESSTPVTAVKRGRRSVAPAPAPVLTDESSDEEDPDISFKKNPEQIIPKVLYLPNMSPKKASAGKTTEPMEVEASTPEPIAMEDLTLGFEKAEPKTAGRKSAAAGRKSTGRKSLVPDWPEDQKDAILYFFDNLNPSQTEQSRIALTCKYTSIQYDRDLPSKLLYQWVQKKGRSIEKNVTKYELPETELKDASLDFFEKLNNDIGETSRIAFACKFLHTQFGVNVTSKQFYSWLNDKGKKAPKRR